MKKGTSILFVNSHNQIILCLRDDKPTIQYPNCWDILGGNVEQDETPKQSIIREIKEELDVELDPREVKLFNVYKLPDRKEYTFWKKADLDIENIQLHEGQCLKWFSEDEVRNTPDEEIAFHFKPIILDFFNKTLPNK